MNSEKRPTRRDLGLALAAASGAAFVPLPALAAEEPAVDTALAASPAPLDPEQRVDVRNGVRALARSLEQARQVAVPNDVDPAFVYLPNGGAK